MILISPNILSAMCFNFGTYKKIYVYKNNKRKWRWGLIILDNFITNALWCSTDLVVVNNLKYTGDTGIFNTATTTGTAAIPSYFPRSPPLSGHWEQVWRHGWPWPHRHLWCRTPNDPQLNQRQLQFIVGERLHYRLPTADRGSPHKVTWSPSS